MSALKVFAPASIGNFVVGFDVLGACLHTDSRTLGDELTISQQQPASYHAVGEFADKLPSDKDNLVIKTAEFFNQQLIDSASEIKPEKLHFELSKNLPIGSGLGSSSSSIVATLFALNEWYQHPFSTDQLLQWSAMIEGGNSGGVHFDNVSPCLLGGLQLINEELPQPCQSLPLFSQWHLALCFPDIEITTKSARKILPANVTLAEAVTMQSRLASFAAACFAQDEPRALACLRDDVVTPKRQQLIPQYSVAQSKALALGAKSFCLSGSGPTCFAICESYDQASHIAETMYHILKQGEHAFHCVASIDPIGARVVAI